MKFGMIIALLVFAAATAEARNIDCFELDTLGTGIEFSGCNQQLSPAFIKPAFKPIHTGINCLKFLEYFSKEGADESGRNCMFQMGLVPGKLGVATRVKLWKRVYFTFSLVP